MNQSYNTDSARIRKKKELFLKTLAEVGMVTEAAKIAGISRAQLYRWKKADLTFAAAWEEALEISADVLEAEVQRRAIDGVKTPVFFKGKVAGTVQKYSDTLLIFLLKARRPERFRDNVAVQVSGSVSHAVFSPEMCRMRELLCVALADYPEAKLRLAKALKALPDDGSVPQITRSFLIEHDILDAKTAQTIDLPALPASTQVDTEERR